MKNIIRYIVKDAKGEYQSAYSTKLGVKDAFKYATLTAKDVYGVIYSVDNNGNMEQVVNFPKPEKRKKPQAKNK